MLVLGIIHVVVTFFVTLSFFIVNPPSWRKLVEPLPFGIGTWLIGKSEDGQTCVSPFSIEAVYHVALLGLSLAALFTWGYFYCFHLLHIVVNNDILMRAVQVLPFYYFWFVVDDQHTWFQAVTKNGKSLLWVAGLMIVIIFIYSQISFAFLRGDVAAANRYCDTPFQVMNCVYVNHSMCNS
jgi:inositol 1,4,5-triphosphate receptor type 1